MQNIKFFLVLFMILVFNSTSAQINLDSIRTRLNNSKKWTKTQKIRYLNVYFQRFENTNNKYDVYLDKKGKLLEYLGCSVIYYEYDDLNRLIKRIGYNLKGNFSLWDFSPIETTEYLNDTIQNNFFDFKYKLSDRKVTIKDSMNRTIEVQYFDKNLKCISRKVNEYIDKENQLIIRDYDGIGHPKSDVNGVSIIVQKFDQLNKSLSQKKDFMTQK